MKRRTVELFDDYKGIKTDDARAWISDPSCIELADADGNTPLHVACASNDAHATAALLLSGASIDTVNNAGHTPITLAFQRDAELAFGSLWRHLLCRCGSDALLDDAVTNYAPRIARMICQRLSPAERSRSLPRAALDAASKGSLSVLRTLVEMEPRCRCATNPSGSLVHHAASGGSAMTVKYCLDLDGSQKQTLSVRGYRPIHLAARSGATDCVRELLLSRVNADTTSVDGDTPIHIALHSVASGASTLACIKVLLAHSADAGGESVLRNAVYADRTDAVELIIDRYKHLDAQCLTSMCRLAVNHGSVETLRALLARTSARHSDPCLMMVALQCNNTQALSEIRAAQWSFTPNIQRMGRILEGKARRVYLAHKHGMITPGQHVYWLMRMSKYALLKHGGEDALRELMWLGYDVLRVFDPLTYDRTPEIAVKHYYRRRLYAARQRLAVSRSLCHTPLIDDLIELFARAIPAVAPLETYERQPVRECFVRLRYCCDQNGTLRLIACSARTQPQVDACA